MTDDAFPTSFANQVAALQHDIKPKDQSLYIKLSDFGKVDYSKTIAGTPFVFDYTRYDENDDRLVGIEITSRDAFRELLPFPELQEEFDNICVFASIGDKGNATIARMVNHILIHRMPETSMWDVCNDLREQEEHWKWMEEHKNKKEPPK